MKKIRLIGISLALLTAFVILAVSLTSVTFVQSSGSENSSASGKEFYFSTQILPDHLGYPVLMAIDRIKLEAAAPLERVYLQTDYANRRLGYAKALQEKNKNQLALTTLSKAHKYLLRAGEETLEFEMPSAVRTHVIKTLEYHIDQGKIQSEGFVDQDRSVIDGLNQELEVMITKLESAS